MGSMGWVASAPLNCAPPTKRPQYDQGRSTYSGRSVGTRPTSRDRHRPQRQDSGLVDLVTGIHDDVVAIGGSCVDQDLCGVVQEVDLIDDETSDREPGPFLEIGQ